MNKKFIGRVILPILIVEISFLFLSWVSYSNKEVDKIKEKSEIKKEMFAMYKKNEETGEYYEITNTEYFPKGYRINNTKTSCVDNKGNIVENLLMFKDEKVTVTSNKTVFCYLYFDKDKSLISRVKIDFENGNGVNKLNSTSAETGNEYDVYYYYGDITHNNVLYGGFCWEMVITTETEGVKLIYNGKPTLGTDAEGNATYNCNNTGEDAALSSRKQFNVGNSAAHVGYMYNKEYKIGTKDMTQMIYVLESESAMVPRTFSDSVTYTNGKYISNNPQNYDVSTDYSQWVGYYYCGSFGESTCSSAYYVAGTNVRHLFGVRLRDGNDVDAYKIKLATSVTENGDGTYTLNNPIEVLRKDWYTNHSTYKNYYYCSDLISETCSEMFYSTATANISISGINIQNIYKYGNSFEDSDGDGVYELINQKEFWNWDANYNTLNNHHYTCFNATGKCTDLYYIHNANKTTAYYTILTNGTKIEQAVNEMFYADDVNTKDSVIKDYIDTWYEEEILGKNDLNGKLYSDYLENAIFCNNRLITDLGGWNPNGGNITKYLYFGSGKLECENKKDRFTLKASMGGSNGYGNNALDYPVGLLSAKEAALPANLIHIGKEFVLLSPDYVGNALVRGTRIYVGTYASSVKTGDVYGSRYVRPVVSINNIVEVVGGDGSFTNPYQLELTSE